MPTNNDTATRTTQSGSFPIHHSAVVSAVTSTADTGRLAQPEQPHDSAPASSGRTEDEETLWEGRYSSRNFLTRAILGGFLAFAWVALAVATWLFGHADWKYLTFAAAVAVAVYWVILGLKFLRARRNHHYRLTTRRLFLSTGLFQRRLDQVELVRVKDLFVQQTLLGSWLNVGTVILISSEQTLPKAHLLGIESPRQVLDLIWRQTRQERDQRTAEVNAV